MEKCRLLGEEVVIIDSPGIDVEADLGEEITAEAGCNLDFDLA